MTGSSFVGGGPAIPDEIVLLDVTARSIDVLGPSSSSSLVRRRRGRDLDPAADRVPDRWRADGVRALLSAAQRATPSAPRVNGRPLIVMSHGGPTAEATPRCSLETQFWTSRGFAIVDVNYGGSTGFGRAYRQRLQGAWGIVDTADCINAAAWLAAEGEVDGDRLLITGGSAGGYTTLCALTMHEGFAAGDELLRPRRPRVVRERGHAQVRVRATSARSWVPTPRRPSATAPARRSTPRTGSRARCSCCRASEDRVVPPRQAEIMVEALREKGLAVRLRPVRGGAARVPQGGVDPEPRWRRSCRSMPRSWASSVTTCRGS